MPLLETLIDHRTGNGLGEVVYDDFSGGLNDTTTPIALSDREVAIAENVDFATEVKAFSSRKGTVKVNPLSFGANVTDGYSWTVGQQYKKCIVMGGYVYDLNPKTGNAVKKIKIHGDEIYPFVMFNRLYFGDGEELYVWGDFDHTTEIEETIETKYDSETKLGTIVRFNGNDDKGVQGHFYMSLLNRAEVEIHTENYLTVDWKDVTDVPGMISNVVRPLPPADGKKYETFKFEILTGVNAAGKIAFCLDNAFYEMEFVTVNEGTKDILESVTVTGPNGEPKMVSVSTVEGAAQKIKNALLAYDDFGEDGKWKLSGPDGNVFTVTATEAKTFPDAFIDVGRNEYLGSILEISWRTEVQGAVDSNNLDPIRKCTMFWMHGGSMRVFAGGNPSDNALYYSEVGAPNHWDSDVNKVYPGSGYGAITGLIELNSYLLVSYQNGWYAWSGVDPIEDARWEQLSVPYGCTCNRSIALTPYSFTYLSRDGIYCIQASILNIAYTLVTSKSYIKKISEGKVEKSVRSINEHKKCRGVFWENSYYLAFGYEEPVSVSPPQDDGFYDPGCGAHCFGEDKPRNRVLVYEWDTKSWAVFTGWGVNQWMTDAEGLFFCTENYVLKANEGHSDVDTKTGEKKAINVLVRTKDFTFASPAAMKEVRRASFVFKQFDGYENSTTDVTVRAGYRAIKILDIDTNESLTWGRTWGKRWGYRASQLKVVEIAELADTFSLEFSHAQIDRPVALLALTFSYRTIRSILPQDKNLLKDRMLGSGIVDYR